MQYISNVKANKKTSILLLPVIFLHGAFEIVPKTFKLNGVSIFKPTRQTSCRKNVLFLFTQLLNYFPTFPENSDFRFFNSLLAKIQVPIIVKLNKYFFLFFNNYKNISNYVYSNSTKFIIIKI